MRLADFLLRTVCELLITSLRTLCCARKLFKWQNLLQGEACGLRLYSYIYIKSIYMKEACIKGMYLGEVKYM